MSTSNALPLGVALHDNPNNVLCDLLGVTMELVERGYEEVSNTSFRKG